MAAMPQKCGCNAAEWPCVGSSRLELFSGRNADILCHRWGHLGANKPNVLGPSRLSPESEQAAQGLMECEMSIDELAPTATGGITQVARTASTLPARPDFIEKLPAVVYAGDRQGRIDQHVGIGEVDAEGKLLRVNAQSCALTGYSSDEMLGRSIFEETYDEDIEADREQFRRQVAGELDRY